MKKYVKALLTILIFTSLFVACSSDNKSVEWYKDTTHRKVETTDEKAQKILEQQNTDAGQLLDSTH